jgi:hypothetical protein
MGKNNGGALEFVVRRGDEIGTVLKPHLYEDGKYIASMTRFEKDYVRVETLRELRILALHGFRIRMSAANNRKHRSPSLISLQ